MNDMVSVHFPSRPIVVGRIGGAYGIKGWVKIISFTDNILNIFYYDPWFVFFKDQWKLMKLECWKLRKKRCCIAKIFGIINREEAMLFNNCNLVIDNAQLPNLYDNEYYWKDIIGCKVITIKGRNLGYICNIIETLAHDILVIRSIDSNNFVTTGNKDCLVPFVYSNIIKNIDLINHVITVDWDYNY